VSRGAAFALASGLFALAIVAGFSVGHDFTWTLFGYVLNSFLYLLLLKERVIADVLAIALGFMLRIFGGAAAAGVEPTSWLAVCGFSLALFLGFCKRRSEINCYESEEVAAEVRVVFRSYTKAKLDVLVGVMAAVTIVTYMMFTVSPDTVRLHGHDLADLHFAFRGVLRAPLSDEEPGAERRGRRGDAFHGLGVPRCGRGLGDCGRVDSLPRHLKFARGHNADSAGKVALPVELHFELMGSQLFIHVPKASRMGEADRASACS
jgi:hypothetical protein